MRLTIDQGNSFTKIAFFVDHNLEHHFVLNDADLLHSLHSLLESFKPTSAILSSVRILDIQLKQLIEKYCRLVIVSAGLNLPFTMKYETPFTVGSDRLANAAGAVKRKPKGNSLVVDCGSCITYTVIRDNCFIGGAISPGLTMRYQALNHFTGKLPLVIHDEFPPLTGTNTTNSIKSGVERGLIAETDGLIQQFCSEIPELNVLITGGSGVFFELHLKSPIFAVPFLTHEGLHEILLLNDI